MVILFASTINDLVGAGMLSTPNVASQGLLDSLKGELMQSVTEWIGSSFGEIAGNGLISTGGQAAFDWVGNLTTVAIDSHPTS